MEANNRQTGFTLIEIAIVLVIVGLLMGVTLAGREVIKAAELRRALSQYDQLIAAVGTFRAKYNCLPGDCRISPATGQPADAPELAGDRMINGDSLCNSESVTLLVDLRALGLVDAPPIEANPDCGGLAVVPRTVIGSEGMWVRWDEDDTGNGNVIMSGVNHTDTVYDPRAADYTPFEAQWLDGKADDRLPESGAIRFIDVPFGSGSGGVAESVCVDTNVTPHAYNTPNASTLCNLKRRLGH